ncbi:MAG: hypothetical protein J6L83_03270 [Clostridia bacterium]|nr:hypothetical protein [Clostridia bacterium]
MAKHRIKKYSRRRSASPYKRSAAPIVISVIAFLILSFVVSIAIGVALGKRAEKEDGGKRLDLGVEEYDSNGKKVSPVEAYHFPTASSPYDYVRQEIYDLSVCVSNKEGKLNYYLEAAEKMPLRENGEKSFAALCTDAQDAGARVCAYTYVTAFDIEDKYEREVVKAFEIALVEEIAQAGASDILLLGIDVSEENIKEVEDFVAKAANSSQNVQLGVAVREDILTLTTESEIYLAARVRSACDYLALDLTHLKVADGESAGIDSNGDRKPSLLEQTLENNKYYVKSYPMRILFSQSEFRIYQYALELGVENMQIVAE